MRAAADQPPSGPSLLPGAAHRHTAALLLAATLASASAQPTAPKPTPPPPPAEYRNQALRMDGNPDAGRRVFEDARTQCLQCHSTDGTSSKAGPDLRTAGDKFSRTDLVRAILEPSANILMGFSTTVLQLRDNRRIEGIVKQASDSELIVMAAGGVTHRIARSSIQDQQTSPLSLMPEGLQNALTPAEFTDLVAFVESLKEPAARVSNEAGTPLEIARLAHPVQLVPAHDPSLRFDKPVCFEPHPVLPQTWIVAEQTNATLWLLTLERPTPSKTLFASFRPEVFTTDTEGLLGFAFHPDFARNRRFFVMHEARQGQQRSMVIAERSARPDGRSDAGEPSRTVLRFDVGTEVHHGGGLRFGPDGFLYIGMGDAGPQGDPEGHGQDLHTLAGKLLRIDVDRRDPGRNHGIPRDNPFLHHPDPAVRREIFAYGLRQPWRFSFDPVTADLWVADVGQDRFEEVGIVRAGENHGWNVFEGFELYSTRHRRTNETFVPPIVSFRRRHGASVTGGFVRRSDSPDGRSFNGVYVCGDFESRRIWGITQEHRALRKIREIGTCPSRIVAFGQDHAGELYAVGYEPGIIYRLDFSGAVFE